MSKLVFRNATNANREFEKFVRNLVGWNAKMEGSDCVVDLMHSSYSTPPNIIEVGFNLSSTDKRIGRFIADIDDTKTNNIHFEKNIPPIEVLTRYGVQSEFQTFLSEYSLAKDKAAIEKFGFDLVDYFESNFAVHRVLGCRINLKYTAYISLLKTAFLLQNENTARAKELILEKEAFDGALPNFYDLAGMIDSFLAFTPYVIAFPASRFTSRLYLIPKSTVTFPFVANVSIHTQLVNSRTPLANELNFMLFRGSKIDKDSLLHFTLKVIEAANVLSSYAVDSRNFIHQGTLDLEGQLRFLAGIRYIFSDFSSMATILDAHARLAMCFLLADKLANLRSQGERKNETAQFKALFSKSQQELTLRILGRQFQDTSVLPLIEKSLSDSYEKLSATLRENVAEGLGEEKMLDRLRNLRNLQHGTYLSGDKFQDIFYKGKASAPANLETILYFALLAFCFEPKQFLEFQPKFD